MDSSSGTEDIFFIHNGDKATGFPGVYFQDIRYRLPSNYQIVGVIGDHLLRALDRDSGRMVKIRHLRDPFSDKRVALSLLKDLVRQVSCFNRYRFFVHLNDVIIPQKENASRWQFTEMFLVYEMMAGTLYDRIYESPLGMIQISHLITQMFIAMSFVDKMNIRFTLDHPRKILLSDYDGYLRLGVDDFLGIDDTEIPLHPEEHPPCYLSKEVIFEDSHYGRESDKIWTLGCILAEMISRRPLVLGSTREEQKASIADSLDLEYLNSEVFTKFNSMDMKFFGSDLLGKHTFGISSSTAIPDEYKDVDPLAIHLLSCLLRSGSKSRASLRDVLQHPWIIKCLSEHPEWTEVLLFIKHATLPESLELNGRLSGLHMGLTERRIKGLMWNEVLKLKMKDDPDDPDDPEKHGNQHHDGNQVQHHDGNQVQVHKGYVAKDFEDTRFNKREEKRLKHMEKTKRRASRFY